MNLFVLIVGIVAATLTGAFIATVIARAGARRDREDARNQMRDTVRAAATEALHDNRSTFFDLARSSFDGLQKDADARLQARQSAIDALVRPMAETLRKVETQLAQSERERIEAFAHLTSQVTSLGAAAQTLSKALRTPAARGRWGEMQLRRVIELSGMLARCDFDEQRTLVGDPGRLRPDVVVHLPGGKQLVVDAKAPLDAFLDAQETPDDTLRAARLLGHARQVRDHMDKLGSKSYWDALDSSPELVVMFLPGETLFSAALQHDLTLIEYGLERRVLLASPITLIALLTTVAHSWRQDLLTENYREVARLGKELHERLATFAGHFDDVRRRLDGAVQAYNSAAGSLEARVMVSARRLRELDITTAGELPVIEPIDTVPRVLRQANLMGLPDGAIAEESEPV